MRGQDKYELYLNAFDRVVKQYIEAPEADKRDCWKKATFYGVRAISLKKDPEPLTQEEADFNFKFASIVIGMIGLLTPAEFITLFPINKDYDGYKWETKDYFYTRDYINTLDPNKPIRENTDTLSFIWEYVNWDIIMFNVRIMGYLSDLRKLEGLPSLAEEWAIMNGIEGHTVHQDHKGNEFIIIDGKVAKASKPRPRHLKLVK